MTQLLNANIFFFVTTIVTILVSLFIIILLYYCIRLVRHLSRLAEKIEDEGTEYVALSRRMRKNFIKHPVVTLLLGDLGKPRKRKKIKSNK